MTTSNIRKRLLGGIGKFLQWKSKYISEKNFVFALSIFVGLVSGLAAVFLKSAVHYIEISLSRHSFHYENYDFGLILYPTLGLFITLILSVHILKLNVGHGITDILYSISKKGGKMPSKDMFSRMLTSMFTVGFGGSAGLEAPIVVTGSAIGSNISQALMLPKNTRIVLLSCGVSGVISAIFNAPIAGVIFVLEVVLIDRRIGNIIPILLSSVTAKLVSMALLGEDILFSFKLKDEFSQQDVPFCLFLGIFAGFISLYFDWIIRWCEAFFAKIKKRGIRVLVGGLSLTTLIVLFPIIYGEGYGLLKSFMQGSEFLVFSHSVIFRELPDEWIFLTYLMLIPIVKALASAITISSGGSGGVFAPSLFVGGSLGFAVSRLINMLEIGPVSESNFTLFGMCGVLSGLQHAPLTAIFLIAELTSGYELFLPLMLVSACSYGTVSYFEPHSIYSRQLIRRGDLVKDDADLKILKDMQLDQLIERDFCKVLPEGTLGDVTEAVKLSRRNIFPVVDENERFIGMLTLNDIRTIMFDTDKQQQISVKNLMTTNIEIIDYQDSMDKVMEKFEKSKAWNLPVVKDDIYVGFISKSNLFNKYRSSVQKEKNELL